MLRVFSNWKAPEHFVMPSGCFRENTFGRRYMSVDDMPYRKEALAAFGFTELADEPVFKNFVGNHYEDKAYTHQHTDPAPAGFMHVRANWMLKKPPVGGDPVLSGEVVPVQEGDLWLCFASEESHASTPISGGERWICSFGALVKRPSNFSVKEFFQ